MTVCAVVLAVGVTAWLVARPGSDESTVFAGDPSDVPARSASGDDGNRTASTDGEFVLELVFPDFDQALITDFNQYIRANRQLPEGEPALKARQAVLELAEGPTDAEATEGAYSPLPAPENVDEVTFDSGLLVVDFAEAFADQAASFGTSTGAAALRASVALTLFQLPEISEIELQLGGSCVELARLMGAEACERLDRAEWAEHL